MTRVALPWTSPTRKLSCARANRRLGVTLSGRRARPPQDLRRFARRAAGRLTAARAAARRTDFAFAPARAVEERTFEVREGRLEVREGRRAGEERPFADDDEPEDFAARFEPPRGAM